jgi:hypothetical protein
MRHTSFDFARSSAPFRQFNPIQIYSIQVPLSNCPESNALGRVRCDAIRGVMQPIPYVDVKSEVSSKTASSNARKQGRLAHIYHKATRVAVISPMHLVAKKSRAGSLTQSFDRV